MRKAPLILACGLVVLPVAILALWPAGAITAPDVKVTFVGLTNGGIGRVDARFQVMNRSRRSIRVTDVSIQNCEPFNELSIPWTRFGKAWRVEPGMLREFRTSFTPLARRWRGAVELSWDTPEQRFRDWLLRQPWQRHLPRKWLAKKATVHVFCSQWIESDPLNL